MATATKTKAGAAAAGGASDGAEEAKGGKKKLVLVVIPLVLVIAGAAAWFFLFRGGSAEAAEEPEPVPGEVLALDPISVNLADGHYLRIGIALQMVEGEGHGEPDGSNALDLTIATFSNQSADVLADPAQRDALKHQLLEAVEHAYHGDVMDIYFTEFVTQ